MKDSSKKLVIFDYDGVVVESEALFHKIFIAEMQKYGINATPDDLIQHFAGNSKTSFSEKTMELYGKAVPDNFQQETIAKTFDYAKDNLEPVKNIQKLLFDLKKNDIDYCIASGGSNDWVKNTLDIVGLRSYFKDEVIFTRETTEKGKPAPDIFNYVADKLGYDKKNCLVVEDSLNGINAGIAANIETIAFLGGQHCSEIYKEKVKQGCDVKIIDDITQVTTIAQAKANDKIKSSALKQKER